MNDAERTAAAHAATRTCNAGPAAPRYCHSLACRTAAWRIGSLRTVRQGGG